MMSNAETITNTIEEGPFLTTVEEDLARLPPEKREHFLYVMHALMDCYKSEQQRAIVLIADAVADPSRFSLLAINADEVAVDEMTKTLSVFRRIKDQTVMN
jgi:hypothetical protein